LGILYLTTCVGLGYWPHTNSLEAFLDSTGSLTSPKTARHHASATNGARIYLHTGLHAYPRATTTGESDPPAHPHQHTTTSTDPPTPGQPPPGRATHLRHPITYLLQDRFPHQQPHTTRRPCRTPAQLASPASVLDARARVREYQPVLHRLRLSASP